VAEDLRDQIESQSYLPWTGVWVVEGLSSYSGRWRMIQTGRIVKSTKECFWEIKGKAGRNQFKGKIRSPGSSYVSVINISMSSDGLSFEGTIDTSWGKHALIKGKKE
jgi:hypothetical protein